MNSSFLIIIVHIYAATNFRYIIN